jgi:hypothetical protein
VAVPEEIRKVADNWQSITKNIKGHLGVSIRNNKLSIDENSVLCVVYSSSIDWETDNKPENIQTIKDEIASIVGKEVPLELRCLKPEESYDSAYMGLNIDNIIYNNINFNVEDIDDENEEEEAF